LPLRCEDISARYRNFDYSLATPISMLQWAVTPHRPFALILDALFRHTDAARLAYAIAASTYAFARFCHADV